MNPEIYSYPLKACIATLLVAFFALGTNPSLADTLDEAIALHDAARSGDARSLEAAVESLEYLSAIQPDNPEIIAYLGSIYAIKAREGRNVFSKMRNVNRSLRQLDRAAELGPENFTVRMIRANVHMNLPPMFNRGDDAIDDMMVLHNIFSSKANPPSAMAKAMVPIYDSLLTHAPDQADWITARTRALNNIK